MPDIVQVKVLKGINFDKPFNGSVPFCDNCGDTALGFRLQVGLQFQKLLRLNTLEVDFSFL